MPTIKMTKREIRKLRPTPGARVDYFDADLPGLALRVTASGKVWTLFYRTTETHKQRRYKLGTLDALSLAQARLSARDTLHEVSNGGDPAGDRKQQRSTHVDTFADLALMYIDEWAKPRKRSWKADDGILRREILPSWRNRPVTEITRRDVRVLVERVAERGHTYANRTLSLLSKLFKFAVGKDMIEASPATAIPKYQEASRDRVLTEAEIRTLWAKFSSLDAPMAAYFQLRLATAQRGGEVASMRWADVDLAGGWWTIPATSSKNKLAHRVPLSSSVVKLLKALRSRSIVDSEKAIEAAEYVLAGARGKRQQAEAAADFGVENFRGHDLRRTAATMMAQGGVSRFIIGKVLNHVEAGITKIYDRASYDTEKRAALAWWDARLQQIIRNKRGGASAKVMPFRVSA
jgi:integrase